MKFKVGDKVIVVKNVENEIYYKIGEVFTILKLTADDYFRGQSEYPSYGHGCWCVGYDEVAPYSLLLEELLSD